MQPSPNRTKKQVLLEASGWGAGEGESHKELLCNFLLLLWFHRQLTYFAQHHQSNDKWERMRQEVGGGAGRGGG